MPIVYHDFKFLGFFNKSGTDLNFEFDELLGMWTGEVNLPEISVGLYESSSLIIVEEFTTTSGNTKWGRPHFSEANASAVFTGDATWSAYWEDETDQNDKFILFTFDLQAIQPKLNITTEAIVDVDIDHTQVGQVTNNIKSESIQFDVALMSETEGIYERYLIIQENVTNKIIARIKFYGEVIGEDERLTVLIQNLGYSMFEEDSPVFRTSDIEEALPDYILLNQKRKEMLLEGKNIQPFVGSYKGVINAIKFFGYNNVKLREYWMNIDSTSANYGKYKTTTVIDIFDRTVNLNDESTSVPNKIYKKTALFSLVYRINEVSNQLDQFDLPIVTESSDFTLEEALIKLYGLKEVLRKRFLPSSSRIIDITGEADYFGKTNTAAWNDQQRIDNLNIGIDPKVNVLPRYGYIQDLRPLGDLFFPEYSPYFLNRYSTLGSLGSEVLGQLGPVLLAYFQQYGPNLDTIAELPDKPGIPVGFPVVLENQSFTITWQDAEVQWDSLWANGSLMIDFLASGIGNGDIFTITDVISNESISYTASAGNTPADVALGLKNAFTVAKAIGDGRPWSYYSATLIDKDNDTTLETLRLRQIISGNFNIDFQPSTQDNNVPGNPKLIKGYASGTSLLSWDTFGQNNFYELEWKVFKNADETPAYEYTVRGDIVTYNTIALNLPYTGFYNVELRLYDTYNNMSSKIFKDHIEVKSREVEFIGFYKFKEREYTWTNLTHTKKLPRPAHEPGVAPREYYPEYIWEEYGSSWDLPIAPSETMMNGEASLYESLDRANYILNNSNPDQTLCYHFTNPAIPIYNTLYTPGPYFWDNTGAGTWDEAYHLWWKSCKVSGDTPANFRIYEVQATSSMTMQQSYPTPYTSKYIFQTSNLDLEADLLNLTNDPVFGKFIYNKVYDVDTSGSLVLQFVQAVAKYTGHNGDWYNFTWDPIPIAGCNSYTFSFTNLQSPLVYDFDYVDCLGNPRNESVAPNTFFKFCGLSYTTPAFGRVTSSGICGGPGVDIQYEQLSEINNPTYTDTRFLTDGLILPKMVHLTFTYDMTKIPGKDLPQWSLRNIDSDSTDDIYFTGRWFTYLFKRAGRYELTLQLKDTNGNSSTKTKNILIIK